MKYFNLLKFQKIICIYWRKKEVLIKMFLWSNDNYKSKNQLIFMKFRKTVAFSYLWAELFVQEKLFIRLEYI